jgi:diguanylate cyclase (GGDEF)-like protein
MPLDYELDSQLKELTEISSEHLDWFIKLTKRLLFVEKFENGQSFSRPVSYEAWCAEISGNGQIDESLLSNLNVRYERLVNLSEKLINEHLKSEKPSSYDEYNELSQFFEKFMDTLRRVEKELILDDKGIDVETGLRKKSVLNKDMDREMQRLARQGKPFSLALVWIDHYDQIAAAEGENTTLYVKHIAELIKKCVRSFDDAYRTDKGEFILSLKQADMTGGIRALERLKELMEEFRYEFTSDTLAPNLASLSCCVAEPLPDDDINKLIDNMRSDLKGADKDEDAVLEYYELSPLQRYVKSS